jgi:DNA-binding NtrC family response regulator
MKKFIRVLIVEQDYSISEENLCRLNEMGCEIVSTVYSADRAIDAIEEKEIDIVLIDSNLHGSLDGCSLAKMIERKYQIPYIFLANFSVRKFKEKIKSKQLNSVFCNSFELQKLHDMLFDEVEQSVSLIF